MGSGYKVTGNKKNKESAKRDIEIEDKNEQEINEIEENYDTEVIDNQ